MLQQYGESAPAGQGALASLSDDAIGKRYCAWRGASERRYVASIYPVHPDAADAGLPAFDGYVLIAVATRGDARRVLSVSAIERASAGEAAVAQARARGADEWHVHFLAESRTGRSAAVHDLTRRHLSASDSCSGSARDGN